MKETLSLVCANNSKTPWRRLYKREIHSKSEYLSTASTAVDPEFYLPCYVPTKSGYIADLRYPLLGPPFIASAILVVDNYTIYVVEEYSRQGC